MGNITIEAIFEVKRGYTIVEIAEATGIPKSTIRDRIHRVNLQPIYIVSEADGRPGTGKGNRFDLDEVLALFKPEKRGRPRTLKV
jgi:predicted transcriptional regulator